MACIKNLSHQYTTLPACVHAVWSGSILLAAEITFFNPDIPETDNWTAPESK